MISAAFLFAPLLAGYIFAVTWKYSRYRCAREDSQRLYFRAAFYGIFFAICGLLTLLNLKLYFPTAIPALSGITSLVIPSFLSRAQQDAQTLSNNDWTESFLFIIFTLTWGAFLGFALNYLWRWLNNVVDEVIKQNHPDTAQMVGGLQKQFKRLVQERGDDLEMMLLTALERTAPVLVTMANRKVYVGTVVEMVEPHIQRSSIRLLPVLSGYRHETDCDVVFTTSYVGIFNEILNEDNNDINHLAPEDFEIVLPINLIQSLSLFDISAYIRFQENKAPSQ